LGADLYIVIRGSRSLADVKMVIEFNLISFLDNREAHEGALRSALWVVEECRDIISSCKGRSIFTGHSLGGSIASPAATILRGHEENERVSAVYFGTFPSMSDQLAIEVQPFIITTILNRDPIAKLSPQNIKSAITVVAPIAQSNPLFLIGIVVRLVQAGSGGAIAEQIMASAAEIAQTLLRTITSIGETQNLVNPGAVYHIVITDGGFDIRRFREDEGVGNIFELAQGIDDHTCNSYRQVLQKSISALKGATLPGSAW
jgi:hypothetical protein